MHLAPYVHFQCFSHALHITTSCTSCFSILAYHVYLMFCNILFYLLFELYFLIHLAPLLHLSPWSYLHLLPFFLLDPFIYSCQKGGEYTLVQYTGEFCHFYITLVHILRGRNSISCAHLQGERYSIGEMHIPRGRRHCVNKKTLFCLCFFMFVFLFAL